MIISICVIEAIGLFLYSTSLKKTHADVLIAQNQIASLKKDLADEAKLREAATGAIITKTTWTSFGNQTYSFEYPSTALLTNESTGTFGFQGVIYTIQQFPNISQQTLSQWINDTTAKSTTDYTQTSINGHPGLVSKTSMVAYFMAGGTVYVLSGSEGNTFANRAADEVLLHILSTFTLHI